MILRKPKNLEQLQELTDYILKCVGDRKKVKVSICKNGSFRAQANTPHYVYTGRRKFKVKKEFLERCKIKELIYVIIHEIAHFKQSKTRKCRKAYLKKGFVPTKLVFKHYHTKTFYRLINKLENRFWNQYAQDLLNIDRI